mgnify:CR=1 FL=1
MTLTRRTHFFHVGATGHARTGLVFDAVAREVVHRRRELLQGGEVRRLGDSCKKKTTLVGFEIFSLSWINLFDDLVFCLSVVFTAGLPLFYFIY